MFLFLYVFEKNAILFFYNMSSHNHLSTYSSAKLYKSAYIQGHSFKYGSELLEENVKKHMSWNFSFPSVCLQVFNMTTFNSVLNNAIVMKFDALIDRRYNCLPLGKTSTHF